MEKRKNLIINKIYTNSISIDKVYDTINTHFYKEEEGYGYVDTYQDDDEISATLIKRSNTQIKYYNIEDKVFEKKTIFIYTEISFKIDLAKNILITFGTSQQQSVVKSALKDTFNELFTIELYNLSPYTFLQQLQERNYKYEISELTIQDFKYNKDIVGKYQALIFNQRTASTIIEKYTSNISRVTVTLWTSNTTFNVTILLNGTISITGEETEFEQNSYFLTSILFE